MRQAYACYSFSSVEIHGSHHYIHYMMMTKNLYRKLYRFLIGPMRPTHTSYAFYKA